MKKDYTIISPLCSQIVRSSTSIYANMSEGSYNLSTPKEKVKCFTIACREAYETLSWLSLFYEIGELPEDAYNELKEEVIEIIRILSKSITTLRSKIKYNLFGFENSLEMHVSCTLGCCFTVLVLS